MNGLLKPSLTSSCCASAPTLLMVLANANANVRRGAILAKLRNFMSDFLDVFNKLWQNTYYKKVVLLLYIL